MIPPKTRYIEFVSNRQTIRMMYDDFASVVADDHYVRITDSSGRRYSMRMKFSDFTRSLAEYERFLLINKGVLVNMDNIYSHLI